MASFGTLACGLAVCSRTHEMMQPEPARLDLKSQPENARRSAG